MLAKKPLDQCQLRLGTPQAGPCIGREQRIVEICLVMSRSVKPELPTLNSLAGTPQLSLEEEDADLARALDERVAVSRETSNTAVAPPDAGRLEDGTAACPPVPGGPMRMGSTSLPDLTMGAKPTDPLAGASNTPTRVSEPSAVQQQVHA